MATLSEILTEVQTNIRRPDSRVESILQSCITEAILKCHTVGKFKRDITIENAPSFTADSTGEYSTALSNLTNFREIFEIVATYTDGSKFQGFIESDTEKYVDYYGFTQKDTYKVLGSTLYIVYDGLPSSLQLKYLSFPTITWGVSPSTDSFIADAFYHPIVNYATAKGFDIFKNKEDSRIFMRMFNDNRLDLLRTFEEI